MMGTSGKLFARHLTATQADVERAETLLNRDGLIPVEDWSGHRGALELWRRHCQRAESSRASMLTAVRRLLELSSCSFERALWVEGNQAVGLGPPGRHIVHHRRRFSIPLHR